jgi:hypothetical protein
MSMVMNLHWKFEFSWLVSIFRVFLVLWPGDLSETCRDFPLSLQSTSEVVSTS